MKLQSYEKKTKLLDYEIETNIKYFNPTFYKEFVEHMRLLKKLKNNEKAILKNEEKNKKVKLLESHKVNIDKKLKNSIGEKMGVLKRTKTGHVSKKIQMDDL